MVRPGLAGPAAEPGRVAGLRGGRRHPGRADIGRTGRYLAGGRVARAHATAGDGEAAHRTLAPVLAAGAQVPDPVRVQALLGELGAG